MVGESNEYFATECDCLTLSVRDIESFARGPVSRAIEHLVIRGIIALAGRGSTRIRIPDLSIGMYQLKMSTVARFHALCFERDERWMSIDRDEAVRVVADCMTEPVAARHARRRLGEALEIGRLQRLDPFSAAALVYAGELPTTFGTPYQARLRARFRLRHRACAPPTEMTRVVA